MIADAFPVLNALREVHLLLAEGAHNQYGDLPWTARHEMLMPAVRGNTHPAEVGRAFDIARSIWIKLFRESVV